MRVSVAALGGLLVANAAQAAPAGLAAATTQTALAGFSGTLAKTETSMLAKGVLKLMFYSQLKLAAAIVAATVVVAGTGVVVAQKATTPASPVVTVPANSAAPSKLNEAQRLYAEWTDGFFPEVVGSAQYTNLSEAAAKEMESQWIAALQGPKNAAYQQAICNLGAIKSRKAVPLLLKIAAERVEKDNADRCMAVRSLGLMGDASVVPKLIPLIYHYNENTRFWAQISLVRLTGQNFGDDWQKWAAWWNGQGQEPKVLSEPVAWPCSRPDCAELMDRDFQRKVDASTVAKLKEQAAGSH